MWANTQEFRREAIHFLKYGYYCSYPEGSIQWKRYWQEQQRRCREGYSVAGQWVTGDHYAYLNFNCIYRSPEEDNDLIKNNILKSTRKKILSFPDFYDGDAFFFHELKEAEKEGQHMAVGKARRKGFSYKSSSIMNTRTQFFPHYHAACGAHLSDYAESTFNMAKRYVSFFNEHTAFIKRREWVNRNDHIEFSYKAKRPSDGVEFKKGYQSSMNILTFHDNPEAAIGKDYNLILFEEAGKFPNLAESLKHTLPTLEDGGIKTGIAIIFGVGGANEDSEDFEELFYNPEAWDIRPFSNQFDEGYTGSVGFFFPNYWNKPGKDRQGNIMMDKEGNSLVEIAYKDDITDREIKKRSMKRGTYEGYISQFCHSPEESFLVSTGSIFPVDELKKWEKVVLNDPTVSNIGNAGRLYRDENGVIKFKFTEEFSINEYPSTSSQDRDGPIVIWEHPERFSGEIPENMYVIGHDPYQQDEGESLGVTYVYKRNSHKSLSGDMLVASYVARPSTADEYNRNLFMLSEYYNAKIGFENNQGKVIDYAKRFKKLHQLATEFTLLDTNEGGRKRHYGVNMNKRRKREGEGYIRDWLLEGRSSDEDGNTLLNLHTIYDPGLLKEFTKYKPDKNADRVMAFMITLYHVFELSDAYRPDRSESNKVYEEDEFFNKM